VVLDEVAEGEMVEKNLVIPDEMLHFLSQVSSLPVIYVDDLTVAHIDLINIYSIDTFMLK
jgi:hypothetical protein